MTLHDDSGYLDIYSMGDAARPPDDDSQVLEREDVKVKKPSMYKVVLLNDDFTPREFVVLILTEIFRKSASDAYRIMMSAHRSGKAVVGVYTYDIANTKVVQARARAKEYEYPLKLVVEGA